MTQSKIIATEWDVEHGGPRDVLGDRFIPWAGRPRIVEENNGKWVWSCMPRFVPNSAFEDFEKLRAAGWETNIEASGAWLLVRIAEHETEPALTATQKKKENP